MKEFLHLFTPVTEALPEKTDENYYVILENGDKRLSYFGHEGRFSKWEHSHKVTHWLDISKLTTKYKLNNKNKLDSFFDCVTRMCNGMPLHPVDKVNFITSSDYSIIQDHIGRHCELCYSFDYPTMSVIEMCETYANYQE